MIGQKHEWQKGPGKKTIGKTERETQNNKCKQNTNFASEVSNFGTAQDKIISPFPHIDCKQMAH